MDDYLTTAEVARELRVTARTVRRLIDSGLLPHVRAGPLLLVPRLQVPRAKLRPRRGRPKKKPEK